MHPYHQQWKEQNLKRWKAQDIKPGVKPDYVPSWKSDIRPTLEKARQKQGWPEAPR